MERFGSYFGDKEINANKEDTIVLSSKGKARVLTSSMSDGIPNSILVRVYVVLTHNEILVFSSKHRKQLWLDEIRGMKKGVDIPLPVDCIILPLYEFGAESIDSNNGFRICSPTQQITIFVRNRKEKQLWVQTVNDFHMRNTFINTRLNLWKDKHIIHVHLMEGFLIKSSLSLHPSLLSLRAECFVQSELDKKNRSNDLEELEEEEEDREIEEIDDDDLEENKSLGVSLSETLGIEDDDEAISDFSDDNEDVSETSKEFGQRRRLSIDTMDVSEHIKENGERRRFSIDSMQSDLSDRIRRLRSRERILVNPLVYSSRSKKKTHNPVFDMVVAFSGIDVSDTIIIRIVNKKTEIVGVLKMPVNEILRKSVAMSEHFYSESVDYVHSAIGFQNWHSMSDTKGNLLRSRLMVKFVVTPAYTCRDLFGFKDPSLVGLRFNEPSIDFKIPLKIFCGTWNMGDASPPPTHSNGSTSVVNPLSEFIYTNQDIDIYALGVQESSDVLEWEDSLSSLLPDYVLLKSSGLWSMRLCIFAKKSLASDAWGIKSTSVRTGVGNVLGNKGAVIVSLWIRHTHICFVNSHLAAHQDKFESRNENVRDIIRHSTVDVGNSKNELGTQYHYLFWMGDLNYRLDYFQSQQATPSPEQHHEISKMIVEDRKYEQLFRTDQLLKAIKSNSVFFGFQEMPINFAPSFKLERGALMEYDPKRSPAWCDRVLYKVIPGMNIETLEYSSAYAVTTSDHKPVKAMFNCEAFYHESCIDRRNPVIQGWFNAIDFEVLQTEENVLDDADHIVIRSPLFSKKVSLNCKSKGIIDGPESPILFSTTNLGSFHRSVMSFDIRDGESCSIAQGYILIPDLISLKQRRKSTSTVVTIPDEVNRSFSDKSSTPLVKQNSGESFTSLSPTSSEMSQYWTSAMRSKSRVKSMSGTLRVVSKKALHNFNKFNLSFTSRRHSRSSFFSESRQTEVLSVPFVSEMSYLGSFICTIRGELAISYVETPENKA